ncbi:F-box/LRR-repeat protein At4g14103-like [Humulus lupulus]|uniref:F-box/LRR-repeat protein At4g14103-like n=1 Tax=Humulus lupulus TaxID=3486 RepID=UPI002B40B9BC|nr:F-box/LRR-repeat protein At4g14103-like [Humulus lupulus]
MAVKGWEKNSRGRPAKKRAGMTSMAEEDRISKLPDAVITHILSFLPTDEASQTCILSKRWKLIWHFVPILSFSDADYLSPLDLYQFVDDCLEHRKRGMYYMVGSVITSFKLEMNYCYQASKAYVVDKWLAFAVQNKVKEINLRLNSSPLDNYHYWLSETVFIARDLTILQLEGLDLGTNSSIKLPALKTLSLNSCYFDDDGLGDGLFKILLGCPSLEKLLIHSCLNLCSAGDQLRLRSSSLKFIKIDNFENVVPIRVEAINLESLELSGFIFENSSLSACKAIRNLTLTFYEDKGIEDGSSLDHIISNLPLLENLTLKDCYKLKLEHCEYIKISNQLLKSFNLKNEDAKYESYDHGMNVIIESAPKLESFCYEGNINFSIAMESSNLLNGKFVIHDHREKNYDSNWFNSMMIFLLNLNCPWNIVTLHVYSDKDLMLSENLKRLYRSPLLKWKHLRVITDCKPKTESDLKDALMWISPSLETLSINEKIIL